MAILVVSIKKQIKKIFLMFVFEGERERQSMSGRGTERETQNLNQAPGSMLSAQSPTQGLNSQTTRS